MNIELLNNFKKEVTAVRDYLLHIQYIDTILECSISEDDNTNLANCVIQLKDHLNGFRTSKKLFEYKASTISLYGILEKYVEIWVKEYLISLSKIIHRYSDIDEKIKANHFNFSLDLIRILSSRESAKYQYIHKEDVLRKLNNCVLSSENYELNTEAFVIFSGNLKHNKIADLLKPLNINLNDGLAKNISLNQEIGLQVSAYQNADKSILYTKLNDLVERRNCIAHGSEVYDILGISELESYIQFLEVYCQAVFEVLQQDLIRLESIHHFQAIENENIINVFNNEIVALRIRNRTVSVGDLIIVESPDGSFMKKMILSIQMNNVSYDKIEIEASCDVGLKLDSSVKKNYKFYMSKIVDACISDAK